MITYLEERSAVEETEDSDRFAVNRSIGAARDQNAMIPDRPHWARRAQHWPGGSNGESAGRRSGFGEAAAVAAMVMVTTLARATLSWRVVPREEHRLENTVSSPPSTRPLCAPNSKGGQTRRTFTASDSEVFRSGHPIFRKFGIGRPIAGCNGFRVTATLRPHSIRDTCCVCERYQLTITQKSIWFLK